MYQNPASELGVLEIYKSVYLSIYVSIWSENTKAKENMADRVNKNSMLNLNAFVVMTPPYSDCWL